VNRARSALEHRVSKRTGFQTGLSMAIAEALESMSPRPGFASELLVALRGTPAFPVLVDDDDRRGMSRWVLPGTVAGAVAGAAGALLYGFGRRHKQPLHKRGRRG
jgi:hypothetical protein